MLIERGAGDDTSAVDNLRRADPGSDSVMRAVIFDLDGTLTVPYLDFDAIRSEIGLPPGPILEALERLTPEERAQAQAVLDRHERDAAENSTLRDGACELIGELPRRGYRVGILTRNIRRWTLHVLAKHGLAVDAIRCRDDGVAKPNPDSVLHLCSELGADPEQSWMVGDHRFDMLAGVGAGTRTVFLLGDRRSDPGTNDADHVIRCLTELLHLLEA
ncbi:MAG: HAD family hydrolase [bacterium]|nr:HAD family hydrolase [bacterium]